MGLHYLEQGKHSRAVTGPVACYLGNQRSDWLVQGQMADQAFCPDPSCRFSAPLALPCIRPEQSPSRKRKLPGLGGRHSGSPGMWAS